MTADKLKQMIAIQYGLVEDEEEDGEEEEDTTVTINESSGALRIYAQPAPTPTARRMTKGKKAQKRLRTFRQ